jgi:hypothetical protein
MEYTEKKSCGKYYLIKVPEISISGDDKNHSRGVS